MIPNIRSSRDGLSVTIADRIVDISVIRALSVGVLLVAWVLTEPHWSSDAQAYWLVNFEDPYREGFAGDDAFLYSPAFAQLIAPFTLLPFAVFYKLLLAVNLACLWWLLGPWSVPALLLPFVQFELTQGNIHLPLAVMCVTGAWSLGLLTKVTPGIGLAWYLGRGEWRKLGVSLGVTLAIVAVSYAVWPEAWGEWLDLLRSSSTLHVSTVALDQWPALIRLPIGFVLLILAARRNRPRAIPLVVLFTLPAIWPGALVLAFALRRSPVAGDVHVVRHGVRRSTDVVVDLGS